jgi:septum formation protein
MTRPLLQTPGSNAPFWLVPQPLLLASTSLTRRSLLENAGLPVDTDAPRIDERAIEADFAGDPDHLAAALAAAKAREVSARHPGRLVLGADQTLTCEGRAFHKPADLDAARAQTAALAGRTHFLRSAAALVQDGAIIAQVESVAAMTMRPLDAAFIADYVAAMGPRATASVGAYQWEGLGVHLFDTVEGDHFTILGLPLTQLLAALRAEGALAG